jgi:predicted Zn-dependent peptidase
VVARLRDDAVAADELERVVAARVGRLLMRRLTSVNQAYYDGLDLLYGTRTEGSLGLLDALKGVTPAQLREAARKYVDPETWVVAVAE